MKKTGVVRLVWMAMLIVGFITDFAQGAATTRKTVKEKLAILDLDAKYGVEKVFAYWCILGTLPLIS
ncbi:MAG: hypothetical protein KJ630_08230 [Proteobacteria bacterium]|nr:hypothetical protein [Pseudomonadota bacterium]